MARFRNTLNHVRIAAPCKADWDQMMGNERVRFCSQCSLNVYNLSSLTRADAESLITRSEGRLCVRFYRRSDGSIITKDCPVGLRALRRRMSYVAKAISSSVLGLLAGLGVYGAVSSIVPIAPQVTMGAIARDIDPPDELLLQGSMLRRAEPPTSEFNLGRMRVEPIRQRPVSPQGKRHTSHR